MLQTSLAGCTTRKLASCSRGMKYSVPATAPVAVRPEKPACPKLFARPKSAILTCPSSPPSSRFSGLRSRWTNPCSCAYARPDSACRARPTASCSREGRAARPEHRAHAAARAVLHREVEAVLGRAVVEQLDDVRMAQRARHVDLALEDLARGRVDERLRQQDLERDRPPVGPAAGQVHGAHAALRERPLDLVALDLGQLGRRAHPRRAARAPSRTAERRARSRPPSRGTADKGRCPPPRRTPPGRRKRWRRRTRSRTAEPRSMTWKYVWPTRTWSPFCRSISTCPVGGASCGPRWRARPPKRTPLTMVPLRLPRSRSRAVGGFTSSRKWCRDAVVSDGSSCAWQSGARPKRNVSWAEKSNDRPLRGPAVTRKATLPGMEVAGL